MNYMLEWYDPELAIKADETKDTITKAEVERLTMLYWIAITAHTIPRRVGPEANQEELAADKHRCRRVAHAAEQLVLGWSGRKTVPSISVDVTRQAAQVDWEKWWAEHSVWLNNRLRYVATWAQKTDKSDKWAKSAVVKLNNEIKWISYALR